MAKKASTKMLAKRLALMGKYNPSAMQAMMQGNDVSQMQSDASQSQPMDTQQPDMMDPRLKALMLKMMAKRGGQ
jgi:hypothetical protein